MRSGQSSVADMSDLDGFSVPSDYSSAMQPSYGNTSTDEFGFDPPGHGTVYPKLETYSPQGQSDSPQLSYWPGFDGTDSKHTTHSASKSSTTPQINMQSFELDRMLAQNLPDTSTTVARFGTFTPPRSNSAASEDTSRGGDSMSPTAANPSEHKKRSSKSPLKDESISSTTSTSGRKRKSTRKSVTVDEEHDDKRRQSLEKNRLAAAKCRVNKKEKTEQLQRDSHDKAVHNAFLKEQVMRMKEEVQQMNALLLSHANCDGCKSPEEIQKHLSNLGNEFFNHHMSLNYGDYSHGDFSDLPQECYSHASVDGSIMNQSLPDFDRGADFEVHTPMQTD